MLPTRFHVPRRTQDSTRSHSNFNYRACTFFGGPFNVLRLFVWVPRCGPTTPVLRLVWALPLSLATTKGIIIYFLLLQVLRCFNSLSCLLNCYVFTIGYTRITMCGFPHSDIPGSLCTYHSPRRFAVRCVLLLLIMPRHSPYALIHLITLPSIEIFFDGL